MAKPLNTSKKRPVSATSWPPSSNLQTNDTEKSGNWRHRVWKKGRTGKDVTSRLKFMTNLATITFITSPQNWKLTIQSPLYWDLNQFQVLWFVLFFWSGLVPQTQYDNDKSLLGKGDLLQFDLILPIFGSAEAWPHQSLYGHPLKVFWINLHFYWTHSQTERGIKLHKISIPLEMPIGFKLFFFPQWPW